MKLKRTVLLAAFVVTMGLLLGASASQSATIEVDESGTNALAIRNIRVPTQVPNTDEVIDLFFDVEFISGQISEIYGAPAPTFDVGNLLDAKIPVLIINAELDTNPAVTTVGPEIASEYFIPYHFNVTTSLSQAIKGIYQSSNWQLLQSISTLPFSEDFTFARWTQVEAPPQVTIGGTVTGLVNAGLVLLNNGIEPLEIAADGPFEFAKSETVGEPYDVTVLTNPSEQECTVENGSGVADADVTNVVVSCVPAPEITLGGTVAGNDSVLVLEYNDFADYLIQFDNGDFEFDTPLFPGDSYDVSVYFEPPGQDCIVANGSGVASDEDVTNVAVACGDSSEPVTIGGTVSGLEGSGLVLQNNGGDDEPIDADGDFTFDTPLQTGDTYSVTVLTNPILPRQECFVAQGSGSVLYQDVTSVAVICAPPDDGPPPPEEDTVCTRELCAADEELQGQCETFLATCLAAEPANERRCVGGALLICGELF